jgi:hypothetical protein
MFMYTEQFQCRGVKPTPPEAPIATPVSGIDTRTSDWILGATIGVGVLFALIASASIVVNIILIARKKTIVVKPAVNTHTSLLHSAANEAYLAPDQYYAMIEEESENGDTQLAQTTAHTLAVDTSKCYSISTSSVHPDQLSMDEEQDMKLSQNEAYTAVNIPEDTDRCYTNQCCGTTTPSVNPDPNNGTVERKHKRQDLELSQNEAYTATIIPVDTNQCYSITTPSVNPHEMKPADPDHIGLTQNQAYTARVEIPSVPMKPVQRGIWP